MALTTGITTTDYRGTFGNLGDVNLRSTFANDVGLSNNSLSHLKIMPSRMTTIQANTIMEEEK